MPANRFLRHCGPSICRLCGRNLQRRPATRSYPSSEQAGKESFGLGDVLRGIAGALAADARDCYRGKVGIARARHLCIASRGKKRRSLRVFQISDHGPRSEPPSERAASFEPTARPLLQDCQRSPRHAPRPFSSQVQPGRIAAILERPQGRHEPGRPAPPSA